MEPSDPAVPLPGIQNEASHSLNGTGHSNRISMQSEFGIEPWDEVTAEPMLPPSAEQNTPRCSSFAQPTSSSQQGEVLATGNIIPVSVPPKKYDLLQRLLAVLKSPYTPEQQFEISLIVMSDCSLLVTFIKLIEVCQKQAVPPTKPDIDVITSQLASLSVPGSDASNSPHDSLTSTDPHTVMCSALESPFTIESHRNLRALFLKKFQLYYQKHLKGAPLTNANIGDMSRINRMKAINTLSKRQHLPTPPNKGSAWLQVLTNLISPNTPEQLEEMKTILTSNRSFIESFIKRLEVKRLKQLPRASRTNRGVDAITSKLARLSVPGNSAGAARRANHSAGAALRANQQNNRQTSAGCQKRAVLISPRTPDQKDEIKHIIKTNPSLIAAVMKQRQLHQKKLLQEPPLTDANPGANVASNLLSNRQHPTPRPSRHSLFLQLLVALRSPFWSTPEYQNRILNILRQDPVMMAAFIKQRQEYAKKQLKPQIKPSQ